MGMQPPKQLSEADSRILTQVFDPESGPTKAEVIVDPFLPSDRQYHEDETVAKLDSRKRSHCSDRAIREGENPDSKQSRRLQSSNTDSRRHSRPVSTLCVRTQQQST